MRRRPIEWLLSLHPRWDWNGILLLMIKPSGLDLEQFDHFANHIHGMMMTAIPNMHVSSSTHITQWVSTVILRDSTDSQTCDAFILARINLNQSISEDTESGSVAFICIAVDKKWIHVFPTLRGLIPLVVLFSLMQPSFLLVTHDHSLF